MKYFNWDEKKNLELIKKRNLSFEEIVYSIMNDGLVDIIEHYNKTKYPNQEIFVVNIDNYIYLVPFVEDEKTIFLKTIIPSRKMTKKYLGKENRK
jgi:uncharacterized DUF497 family protein